MSKSEAQTRKEYIDPRLEQAGWKVLHENGIIARNRACIEIKTEHMPITDESPNGNGYVDYVLFGDDGKPLAVVEAKKSIVNESIGRTQACLYADSLEKEYGVRPVIYYTNGYSIYVNDGIYPDRKIFGFHTKDDLEHIIQKRKFTLSDRTINPNISDRYYQAEAINKVLDAFSSRKSRSLIVLATGTGKTRVSCSLSDLFIRNNFVKRILFLADRRNLVKQAKEECFDRFLPSVPTSIILEGKREDNESKARVVFSTYQSMLSIIKDMSKNPYSVGYFDLIIVDEAHRSLFNKYGEIFDYFDAMMIGLTATPRDDIHHSTYKVFDIDNDNPNYEYDLVTGVRDGYLTYYRALDRTPDILKNGLVYDNLDQEEKEKYEDEFTDDDGNIPETIEGKYFYSTITNLDTIRKVLKDLMEEGIYVNNGDTLGKTIIFAKDKKHADLIVKEFRKMYPELCNPVANNGADYCVAIYNDIRYNEMLQREFKVGQKIRIVVSVDMMDTGVDVPDVVNLVFFKKVLSKIKFWQMVGRGTRLCKDIKALSPSKAYFERHTNDDRRSIFQDKPGFLIFDICNVFNFFKLNPDGKKTSSKADLSLTQQIFLSRVRVFKGLQKDYAFLDDKNRAFHDRLKKELHEEIVNLNDNYIGVQSNLKYVEKYRNIESWDYIDQNAYKEIEEHIAQLIQGTIDIESAKRFDFITYEFMDSRHDSDLDGKKIAKLLYKIIVKGLLETKLHIGEVKAHEDELREFVSDEFLNNATPVEIDEARQNIRDLTRFIEKQLLAPIITDFKDRILKNGDADDSKPFSAKSFMPYDDKVYSFIKDSIDDDPYKKIHEFNIISTDELEKIKEDLESLDETDEKVDYSKMFVDENDILPYVRRTLGISQLSINAYVNQYKEKGYNSLQVNYIRNLLLFLSQNGTIEKGDLLNPDLDFDGIFDSKQINDVMDEIIKRI